LLLSVRRLAHSLELVKTERRRIFEAEVEASEAMPEASGLHESRVEKELRK
jgi:hypothetical protein